MVVTRGWGLGNGELLPHVDRVQDEEDEKVNMDGGEGCTTV